jgi:hypothetical protein
MGLTICEINYVKALISSLALFTSLGRVGVKSLALNIVACGSA